MGFVAKGTAEFVTIYESRKGGLWHLKTELYLVISAHLRAYKLNSYLNICERERMAHKIKSVRMLVTLTEGIFPFDATTSILSLQPVYVDIFKENISLDH